MPREALINLEIEHGSDCAFVSSPEFPMLHLAIADDSELELKVLPVLKEMILRDTGKDVELRLIKSFEMTGGAVVDGVPTPKPHVIAQMAA